MTVYGWYEQNEAGWGIISVNIQDDNWIIDPAYNTVMANDIPRGMWYKSFKDAKRAALYHWRQERDTALLALKEIRKQKCV